MPVDVAYDSDVELVEKLLLKAATENPHVMDEPKPRVTLKKFDGGTLNLELWLWSETKVQNKTILFSDLNFAIVKEFRAHDIEVPEQEVGLSIPKDYELKSITETKQETEEEPATSETEEQK